MGPNAEGVQKALAEIPCEAGNTAGEHGVLRLRSSFATAKLLLRSG